MKKFILLLLMAVAIATSGFAEKRALPMQVHNGGRVSHNIEEDRCPINIPLVVFYDSDTNTIEVWCDDDNIQAEVYIYDESGAEVIYSPYMNVTFQLSSSKTHSIHIIGDGWEAEGII